MLKTKCNSTSLENPLATGGCLEHNIYRVTPLAWLKEEDEQFWFSTISGLKQLLHIAITIVDWGRLHKLLDVLLDASICSPVVISSWKR